jgi:aminoglycoside phosphotransferase (APT) family kinase protein
MGGDIMAIESAVLPHFAGLLPLTVPNYQFFGQPVGAYPWQFVGYRFLPGKTSESIVWTPHQRQAAAPILGNFLRELHSIPVSLDLAKVLPPDLIDRTRKEALLARIDKYHSQIHEGYPENGEWTDHLRDLAHDISDGIQVEPQLTIVHGDLYPRHILANKQRQIVGVIDWGDVHYGHPFLDLSIDYTFLESKERSEFWQAYELPISDASKVMARLKSINYAFSLHLYGRHTNDQHLLNLCDQIADRVSAN